MTQALTRGLPAVIVAAALYGCAPVLQARASRTRKTISVCILGGAGDARRPVVILATPTPYVLLVAAVLSLSLLQRGLQSGASVLAFPVTSFMSAFVPLVIGITVLDDAVPGDARGVAFVCALLAVAAGVSLLARDRAAAESRIKASE